jgi:hypothetical protein
VPGDTYNVVDDQGRVVAVPEGDLAGALQQGFRLETDSEKYNRASTERISDVYDSPIGKALAVPAGVARGFTLGLSDVVLDQVGGGEFFRDVRDANPITSIGSEIAGGIAGALTGAGPAGAFARGGARIVEGAAGRGIAARFGASVGAGALEGAGQGAGSYISQVALDDKPLSAEGFIGAVGSGALFGGAAGGTFGVAEQSLVRAKSMFARGAVTREATQVAEQAATSEIRTALVDGDMLSAAGRDALRANRAQRSASDLATAEKLNALKVQQAEERLKREAMRTQQLEARATAPKQPRRARKAFDEPTPVETTTASQAAAVTDDVGDPGLMAQLGATKNALDNGATLGDLSRGIDDAADNVVSMVDPAHAKLADAVRELDDAKSALDSWLSKYGGKQGNVGRFERSEAARAYADNLRPAQPAGYQQVVPRGEGNARLARGREWQFRGTEGERRLAEDKFFKRQAEGEGAIILADAEVASADLARRWKQPGDAGASVAAALRSPIGETAMLGDDVSEAITVISRYEKASAEVAEQLGPEAPAAAVNRAQGYRAAIGEQQEASAAATAAVADDLAKKLPPDQVPASLSPSNPSNVGGVSMGGASRSEALDFLAVLDVAGDLPIGGIPVIGPVLKLYLKARAIGAAWRRLGGKVPKTVESTIATKAAATTDRVRTAVDQALTLGAKGAGKMKVTAGPLGGLGYKLFSGRVENDERDAKPGRRNELQEAYDSRIAELAASQQPNAIADAVRARIRTSDPMLQAALIDTVTRKLAFLDSKAPKRPQVPTLLRGDGTWRPGKSELQRFGRYVDAAENPAGVLEQLASTGTVSIEAAETLRTVYPTLYREAQLQLLQRAPDIQETLPYSRRVALSVMFQIPVDGTMDPSYLQFLQQGQPAANAAPAQGSPAAAPPTPTTSGPVTLGDRSMTRLDRRAGA